MRTRPTLLCLVLVIPALAACAAGLASTSATPSHAVYASSTSSPIVDPTSRVETDTPTIVASNTPSPTYQVKLDAVGDIMLARSIGEQVLAEGPQVVFAGVQSILEAADIRVGNLECSLTEGGQPERKSYTLKAPPQAAKALTSAGFDLLSLANNHSMDYGVSGLEDTLNTLRQAGIAVAGAGLDDPAAHAPVIIEKNGLRLAFLAYVDVIPELSGFNPRSWIATPDKPGIAWADPSRIKADVSSARREADLVIVLLHAGSEIGKFIPSLTEAQLEEAHAAIDAGATVVLGSHPHVLQRIERYHGGLIAYSLGNFVFDQYNGPANASLILRVVLDRSGLVSYDYVPVLIENGLPVITTIDHAHAIETLVAP